MITDKIEVSDTILASGGFADIGHGTYMGSLVAVKTMRVSPQDDFLKIRKVSIDNIFFPLGTWPQSFCSSNFAGKSFSGTRYPTQMS